MDEETLSVGLGGRGKGCSLRSSTDFATHNYRLQTTNSELGENKATFLQVGPATANYLQATNCTKMSEKSAKSLPWNTVLWAWLLVGTLDITAAIVNYWIGGGRKPVSIFVYIASGVFGSRAFEAGTPMAWWGLFFHYLIAFIWTAFFFFIYPRLPFLSRINWIAVGIIYGAFIWLIMNRVVLQIAHTPKGPFRLTGALIQCAILVAMIGLPLAYIASRKSLVQTVST
jgi:hypothetical protein